jgi:ketosteroid isomerase-like protein
MMVRVDRPATPRAPERAKTDLVRDAYRFIDDVQVGRRHDYDAGYSECFDEAFELLLPPTYPEGEQVFRGRPGLRRWIKSITEIWEEWQLVPERLDVAGDQVVVLIRVIARGHLSGVRLDRETAHIWSIADGRVTRCEVYFDRSEAMDAVSL